MIPLITLILFGLFLTYLIFGIVVLVIRFSSLRNRMFFTLCFHLSIWSLGYALMTIAPDKEMANLWRMAASFGFSFVYSVWLDFAILIRKEDKKWMSDIRRLLIYIPAFFFFFCSLQGTPEKNIKRYTDIWIDHYSSTGIWVTYYIYFILFLLGGILTIYRWGKVSNNNNEKRQARVIVISALITLVLGILRGTILPLIMVNTFSVGVIVFGFTILGLYQAISKYKMLTLDSWMANDYILKTMNDPVILINRELKVIEVNRSALLLTGYSEDELIGTSMMELVSNENYSEEHLYQLFQSGTATNIEIDVRTKKNERIPCLFSELRIKNEYKDDLGTVCIFHNISDRKNLEQLLQNRQKELERLVQQRSMELEDINRKLMNEITERRAGEEMLRELILQSTEGILVIDMETLECLECNEVARKILGIPVGQHTEYIKFYYYNLCSDNLKPIINKLIFSEEKVVSEELVYIHENGTRVTLHITSTLVGYSNKQYKMISIQEII